MDIYGLSSMRFTVNYVESAHWDGKTGMEILCA
jgi:hypothetical protein